MIGVQTGNILYIINREHGLHVDRVSAKEPIGLVACDNDRWEIRYSFHRLGVLDQRTQKIIPAQQWHQRE